MRQVFVVLLLCLLAACTTPGQTTFDETTYGINRAPNTARRGSEDFCRTYGNQSAANRIESSQGERGTGTSGFSIFLAQNEGKRAYERCLSGGTS